MSLIFNTTNIDAIVYNGTNLTSLIFNGVTVWSLGGIQFTATDPFVVLPFMHAEDTAIAFNMQYPSFMDLTVNSTI